MNKLKPVIRFKGFTNTWEQRKFSNIAEIKRGLTYKPSDIEPNGIRVLRSSNINEDTFILHIDDIFVKKEAININYVANGDILITSANGSLRLVGKHAIINGIANNSAVCGGFMLVVKTKQPNFTNALMSSDWYEKFINLYVSGGNGAIGNLSQNDLSNAEILIPNLKEQTKIGNFFKSLDNLITLHQRKCDKLKEIKKYCLQKMFV